MIKGGTLKLGSNLNQNGQIEVYDEANNLIAKLDKNGLIMYGLAAYPVGSILSQKATTSRYQSRSLHHSQLQQLSLHQAHHQNKKQRRS